MSYRTIAAALALEDVSIGERLVAFSLASYADAEHQTFVGNPAAAARTGLSRSQYLAAREQLEGRELISVAAEGGGRGRSSTLTLGFATRGPWREERINPQLFQTVLSYTRARGPARVLLATLAALANDEREVLGLTTDEIRSAAGLSDRTYRRARASLLASGELVAESCVGGREHTNRWRLADPRDPGTPLPARKRVAPARNARPLLAAATQAVHESENPGQDRTVCGVNPGQNRTLLTLNPGHSRTVSALNPGQDRTVSPETLAETPAETAAPNARAGREPGNQKNNYPPTPPDAGSRTKSVTIVEDYLTDRGRKRQRTVVVEVDAIHEQLRAASDGDLADWERIRSELRALVGESTFEIWLAQLELAATDPGGRLVLAAPASTRSWVAHRFARAFDHASVAVDRSVRLADERELRLLDALATSPSPAATLDADALPHLPHPIPHKEAV
jgi:DnaA N-terminal domain